MSGYCLTASHNTYAWVQYCPDSSISIGLTVNEGDEVYVAVWLSDANHGYACNGGYMSVYFYNVTTYAYGLYIWPIPAGHTMPCDTSHQEALFVIEQGLSGPPHWRNGVTTLKCTAVLGTTLTIV